MPISDLGGWTLPSQTCFQLYGTKRKNTDKEDQMILQQDPMVLPFAKRKCFLPVSQEQQNPNFNQNQFLQLENTKNFEHNASDTLLQQVNTCMQSTETNENNVEMMDSEVEMGDHQEQGCQHLDTCQQQKHTQQQRQLLIKRTEKLEEQLKFIQEQDVESNDYWAAPSDSQLTMQDEIEQARIQMESDFSPDPYQYRSPGPDTLPMMGYDVRTKVRCYCKPTWEGVMNQNCFI